MRNAGQYTSVVLLLLTQVHCKEDPVNTLLKLLDRVDNKPMVKHLHSHAADPVNSLFQLFDRTDQKPMVVIMEKGKEPRSLDFVVDDGTGSDNSIRDLFGMSSTSDESEDKSSEEKYQKNLEALAEVLLAGSDKDKIEKQINILRQDLISRCGQKQQCGNKQNQCNANCKKIEVDKCSEKESKKWFSTGRPSWSVEESEDECQTTTTKKCPKKWFSTGRPSW